MIWPAFSALLLLFAEAAHGRPRAYPHAKMPPADAGSEQVFDVAGNALPPLNTTYYFDQLIDHNDPSLGTFKQRYYHTWQYYQEGKYGCLQRSCVAVDPLLQVVPLC